MILVNGIPSTPNYCRVLGTSPVMHHLRGQTHSPYQVKVESEGFKKRFSVSSFFESLLIYLTHRYAQNSYLNSKFVLNGHKIFL